ncbi:MAG: tetratricopeptide repeat protein [Alistipes sp.]|nr:tetratricopeptide repeat protein [Alistipes sp.]
MRIRWAVYGLVATLLFCGFTKGPQQGSAPTANQPDSLRKLNLYTDAVKRLVIYGDSVEARRLSVEALAVDSLYAPANHLLSRVATNQARATEAALAAYNADKENHHYLAAAAEALVRSRRYREAVEYYSELTKRSNEPDYFRILALLYESDQRHFSAIAVLDSAEIRFGRIPQLSRMRQQLYITTKQFEKAEREALQLVEEAPYLSDNHLLLAELYAATGRDSLARASYSKAIKADSTAIQSWLALGDYFLRRRNYSAYLGIVGRLFDNKSLPVEQKREQFKALTSNIAFYRNNFAQIDALAGKLAINYPDDREVAELYARHLIASGQVATATDVLKRLLNRSNPSRERLVQIIELENYLGRSDSVEVYLDLALEHFPTDGDLKATRGHLHAMAARHNEAITSYREALKYAQNDTLRSRLWGYIGDAEHNIGEVKRAYKAFDKSLRLYPDNTSVLNNYAYFLAVEGRNLERALEMARRATTLSQNNSTFLDTLAWVLYRMGEYEEAKRYMQQAMSLDRDASAELALHYGDILDALGEEFMAQTYWRKALERGYDASKIDERIKRQRERKEAAQGGPKTTK